MISSAGASASSSMIPSSRFSFSGAPSQPERISSRLICPVIWSSSVIFTPSSMTSASSSIISVSASAASASVSSSSSGKNSSASSSVISSVSPRSISPGIISVISPAAVTAFFFSSAIWAIISISATDSISPISSARSSSTGSSSSSGRISFSGWRSFFSASPSGIVSPIFFFFGSASAASSLLSASSCRIPSSGIVSAPSGLISSSPISSASSISSASIISSSSSASPLFDSAYATISGISAVSSGSFSYRRSYFSCCEGVSGLYCIFSSIALYTYCPSLNQRIRSSHSSRHSAVMPASWYSFASSYAHSSIYSDFLYSSRASICCSTGALCARRI